MKKLDSTFIKSVVVDGKVRFALLPDDSLVDLVKTKTPVDAYARLTPFICDMVLKQRPIPLHSDHCYVIGGDLYFRESA